MKIKTEVRCWRKQDVQAELSLGLTQRKTQLLSHHPPECSRVCSGEGGEAPGIQRGEGPLGEPQLSKQQSRAWGHQGQVPEYSVALCQSEWEGEGDSEVQRGRKRKREAVEGARRRRNREEADLGRGRGGQWPGPQAGPLGLFLSSGSIGALRSSPAPDGMEHCWFSRGES